MEKQTNSLNEQRQGMLKVLHTSLSVVDDHHTSLERKLQYNLAFMSSIAALEFVIHLHLSDVASLPNPMIGAALLFGLNYLAVAALSLCAVWPKSRALLPFEPTWDNVKKWWAFSIIEYRDSILSSYVKIWEENRRLLDDKIRWTRWSYSLVVIALLTVAIQALLYRHHFVVLLTISAP